MKCTLHTLEYFEGSQPFLLIFYIHLCPRSAIKRVASAPSLGPEALGMKLYQLTTQQLSTIFQIVSVVVALQLDDLLPTRKYVTSDTMPL